MDKLPDRMFFLPVFVIFVFLAAPISAATCDLMKTIQQYGLDSDPQVKTAAIKECFINSTAPETRVDGFTPLEFAVSSSDFDAVKVLLALGADPNTQNEFGDSPLSTAASFINGANLVELLLDAGARLDLANRKGETPLMSTFVGDCKVETGLVLLNAGARLDQMSSASQDMARMALDMMCSKPGDEEKFKARVLRTAK